MYEQEKVAETEYFLSQMLAQIDNVQAFKFNLSAFLTAARTALQFALDDARKIKGGQAWYDNWMSKSIYFASFKKLRNVNIHEHPVSVSNSVTITPAPVTIRISVNSPTIIIRDSNGEILSSERAMPPLEAPSRCDLNLLETRAFNYYSFADWSDDTSVEILCQEYLDELKTFVTDGVTKGFLTTQ